MLGLLKVRQQRKSSQIHTEVGKTMSVESVVCIPPYGGASYSAQNDLGLRRNSYQHAIPESGRGHLTVIVTPKPDD